MAWLHQQKLSASTVKNYLAAVRYTQISLGLGEPNIGDMPRLSYVVRGMKRLAASGQQQRRMPITPAILMQLKGAWQAEPNQRDATMLWAAATMCFFGFLRVGEIVVPNDTNFDTAYHLTYMDVRVNSHADPRFVQVQIKASKTDPFRKGVAVYLGRGSADLCPVAASLNYMVQRGPGEGPFFRFSDGRPLTRERFVAAVRSALRAAGVDCSRYAGHSFRIGAATTAAHQGIQDSLIKTMGRWESAAYTLYIRTPRDTLCSVSAVLAGAHTIG